MARSSRSTRPASKKATVPEFPPEIYLQIVSFCDTPTLAALASTSRTLWTLSTPALYRNVSLSTDPYSTHLSAFTWAFRSLQGQSDYYGFPEVKVKAGYVHSLEVDVTAGMRERADFIDGPRAQSGFVALVCDKIQTALPGMVNLKDFRWKSKWFGISTDLHRALAHMPMLQTVDLAMGPCDYQTSGPLGYPHIRTAKLWNIGHTSLRRLEGFRRKSPKLQELHLSMSACIEESWDEVDEVAMWESLFPAHEKLGLEPVRSLSLFDCPLPSLIDKNGIAAMSVPGLASEEFEYTKELRHLESLTLSRCWEIAWLPGDEDVLFFERYGHALMNLRELVLQVPNALAHGLNHYLQNSPPHLRSLTLIQNNLNMQDTIPSITHLGASLEILVLEHAKEFDWPSGEITLSLARSLANSCPNLTELSLDDRLPYSDWVEMATLFAQKLPKLSALNIRSAVDRKIELAPTQGAVSDSPATRTRAKSKLAMRAPMVRMRRSLIRTPHVCVKAVVRAFAKHDRNLKWVGVNGIVAMVGGDGIRGYREMEGEDGKEIVEGADVPWCFRAREALPVEETY